MSRPEFIGIGAARAGTTWLAKNLALSEQVWIPSRKELHYFTRGLEYHSPSFLADDSLLRYLLGRQKHHGHFRKKVLKALARDVLHASPAEFAWHIRYFFGRHDDDWYRSLFAARPEPITGEITPAYSLLKDADVERIGHAFPETKFIMMVRNPVDREWSTLLYHERRYSENIIGRSEAELLAYLSQPGLVERSDFAGIYKRWLRHVGSERFLLVFYDEIVRSPQSALDRVFRFLGVTDREQAIRRARYQAINASRNEPIPPWLEAWLSRRYLENLQEFAGMAGGEAYGWLERARAAIDRCPEPVAGHGQPVRA